MTYAFTIPLAPEASPRHRDARLKTGRHIRYPDPKGVAWRLAVAACASQALAGVRLEGPQSVTIVGVFPRPGYLLKLHGRGPNKGQPVHPTGRIWFDKKPDRDNLDKGILDGLKAYWSDDCIVVCGEVLKCYCAMNEVPHVEVYIEPAPVLDLLFVEHRLPLPYAVSARRMLFLMENQDGIRAAPESEPPAPWTSSTLPASASPAATRAGPE